MKDINKSKIISGVIVALALLMAAGWILLQKNNKDNDKDKPEKSGSVVQVINGVPEITLSNSELSRSGIITQKLQTISYKEQLTGYGTVVSIVVLSGDVQQYESDAALLAKAKQSISVSKRNFERTKSLFEKKLASQQDYQSAMAAYLSDKADLNSESANLSGLKSKIHEQWGDRIYDWIINQNPKLNSLLSLKEELVQIAPSSNKASIPPEIFVQSPFDNGKKILCRFISAGHLVNSQFQTRTLYYIIPGSSLNGGMNVKAFLPAGKELTGVVVPSEAIIWYQGSAWVYAEGSPDKFYRVKINTDNTFEDGFFIPAVNTIKPGVIIVSKGAQLLLSEELNSQTKNTGGGEGDND